MAKSVEVKWGDRVQARLTGIAAAQENCEARYQELERQRKEIETRLRELGALNTRGIKKKLTDAGLTDKQADILINRNDLVVTYFSKRFVKSQLNTFADKYKATIDDAKQGKFPFDDDESNSDLPFKEPSEAELFSVKSKADDDEDHDQQTFPVGQPRGREPNSLERAKLDGYVGDGPAPAGMTSDISELELPDRITRHLYKAGLGTIGKLIEFGEQHGNQYTEVEGIGQSSSDEIHATLKKFRRKQRAADTEKELEAASAQ